MDLHLRATRLLDHEHPALRALVEQHGWRRLARTERIGAIYAFVRDEIAFGYNASDDIRPPPSWPMVTGSATPRRRCSWRCCAPPTSLSGSTE